MLSYLHAYHAGNPADLHKHSAYAALIALLTRKARGISILESHAGRGLYDLDGAEARKTGEAAQGIDRVPRGIGPFWAALDAVRAAHGARAYPGSPLIARHLMRPQDRLVLCELHPAEHPALVAAAAGPGVAIHRRDGHEGLVALTPPEPRRGIALIDPSYEVKDEFDRTADTALALVARWPEGAVLIWYPVLPAGRHEGLAARLADRLGPALHRDEVRFVARPERGMTGSGLLGIGLPHGGAAAMVAARAGLAGVLASA